MHAIFVTLDSSYAGLFHLFLRSLHVHWPSHPRVIACTAGWPEAQRRQFDRRFPFIEWVDMHDLGFPVGPAMGRNPFFDRPVMYARWAALTPRFDAYDTVLYLDVDTLVLGSLDELFEAESVLTFYETLPGTGAGIFDDPDEPALRSLLEEDGLAGWCSRPANAGVVVLPRRFRTREQYAEVTRLTVRYAPYLRWGDQSVLNLWLARNRIAPAAGVEFNYQLRLIYDAQARRACQRARVLHFNGQHGRAPLLMALAYRVVRGVPWGRRLLGPAMRLVKDPRLVRMPGYRVRRAVGRVLTRGLLDPLTSA
jgi:hypothetical protein